MIASSKAVLTLWAFGLLVGQSGHSAQADVAAMDVAELIACLPAMEAESLWDAEEGIRVVDPVVAELKRRVDQSAEVDDGLLVETLLSVGAIRYRSHWPRSEPFAVSLRVPRWLHPVRIRLVPDHSELAPATAGHPRPVTSGTTGRWLYRDALFQNLGRLPVGEHGLAFEVFVERRAFTDPFKGERYPALSWSRPVVWNVVMVDTVDAAVAPVSGMEVDRAVGRAIGIAFDTVAIGGTSRRAPILVVEPDARQLGAVALSLDVELMYLGKVVEAFHLATRFDDPTALRVAIDEETVAIGFHCLAELDSCVEDVVASREGWSLHVCGTSRDVLRVWEADSYWAGELWIPLDQAIRREIERMGSRGRQGPWLYSYSR